jgi:hypothetical protein
MKVDMFPSKNLLTNMPIMLKISGEKNAPSVEVEGLGKVPVSKEKDLFVGEFWSQKEGKYQVVVRGENSIWRSLVSIEKQEYITFNQEMAIFGGLLVCSAIGLVLWMKRLKKI